MERKTTIAIDDEIKNMLIDVKGYLEKETNEIISFKRVIRILIESFNKQERCTKGSGGGKDNPQ